MQPWFYNVKVYIINKCQNNIFPYEKAKMLRVEGKQSDFEKTMNL